MKQTRLLMGMPVTVEIIGGTQLDLEDVFGWFEHVDARFSTYKITSEVSEVNAGLPRDKWSDEMREVLDLCEQTKQQTHGYFDIGHQGKLDPSGLVKGWAIQKAAELLEKRSLPNFYLEAGGDIQVRGQNAEGDTWRIGIRNPFNREEVVKVVRLHDEAVATSGTYIRGQHIYDPHNPSAELTAVQSLSVIGPNIYDADRFATAAFAMGEKGISFIEKMAGLEGYQISKDGLATFTSNFERYVV